MQNKKAPEFLQRPSPPRLDYTNITNIKVTSKSFLLGGLKLLLIQYYDNFGTFPNLFLWDRAESNCNMVGFYRPSNFLELSQMRRIVVSNHSGFYPNLDLANRYITSLSILQCGKGEIRTPGAVTPSCLYLILIFKIYGRSSTKVLLQQKVTEFRTVYKQPVKATTILLDYITL